MEIESAIANNTVLTEQQVDALTAEQLSDPEVNKLARSSIVKVMQDDTQQEVLGYPNGAEPLSYEHRKKLDYQLLEIAALEDAEKNYLEKTVSQILLGNYTEDATALGSLAQVGLGFTGLDFAMDMRDLWHNLTHWEWSWNHLAKTGLNAIGLLPVIGMVNRLEDVSDVAKALDKAVNTANSTGKFATAAQYADDVLNRVLKSTEDVADATKHDKEIIDDVIRSAIDSSDEIVAAAKNIEISNPRYKAGYATHMAEVQSIVWKGGKGIVGGHNYERFKKVFTDQGWDMDECIISVKHHPDFESIYEVKYQIPAIDKGKIVEGQYKHIRDSKGSLWLSDGQRRSLVLAETSKRYGIQCYRHRCFDRNRT